MSISLSLSLSLSLLSLRYLSLGHIRQFRDQMIGAAFRAATRGRRIVMPSVSAVIAHVVEHAEGPTAL